MSNQRGTSALRRRGPLGAAALLIVALAAGCSFSVGGSSLDIGELEDNIAAGIKDARGFDAVVECPNDVDAEEGDEFTCKATAPDGTTATVLVTQTNDDGDVTWRLVANGETTPSTEGDDSSS